MKTIVPPVLLFATLLCSCGGADRDGGGHGVPPPAIQEDAHTGTTEVVPSVSLNNGQRWKANPETTTGIAHMVDILGAYDPSGGDPKALKDTLETEFGLIFERCTMSGEAHVQLHNYLLPIHQQLRDFQGTGPEREALGQRLAAYGTYFE